MMVICKRNENAYVEIDSWSPNMERFLSVILTPVRVRMELLGRAVSIIRAPNNGKLTGSNVSRFC